MLQHLSVWDAPISVKPLMNTQSALIGQLTHAWTSTANNKRAAELNQLLHAKQAAWPELCKYVKWWCSVMSQSHGIKGGTTDKAFQEQGILGERSFS